MLPINQLIKHIYVVPCVAFQMHIITLILYLYKNSISICVRMFEKHRLPLLIQCIIHFVLVLHVDIISLC